MEDVFIIKWKDSDRIVISRDLNETVLNILIALGIDSTYKDSIGKYLAREEKDFGRIYLLSKWVRLDEKETLDTALRLFDLNGITYYEGSYDDVNQKFNSGDDHARIHK